MQGNKFLEKIQKSIAKNSPTILAVMAGIGAIASVGLAIDGTIQSKKRIEQAKEESPTGDISKADKALIYVKSYAPTACMVAATELCIYGSHKIHEKRLATLGAAYILSESNFKEYKEKAEELFGEKKTREIEDAIVQKHIDEMPQTPQNTCENHLPNATQLGLWFDETSRRYFYSNAEYIRRAELEATAMLKKNGFVSINDVYDLLGIESIPLGDDMGWQSDIIDEVVIQIDAALMGPDIPVGTIRMEVHPTNAWMSEV
jgi:hypothetical protein